MLDGVVAIDANGNKIVQDYHRHIPSLDNLQTWYAFLFILFGIAILLYLEWYGRKNKQLKNK